MFKKLCEFNAFPSSKALLSCSSIPLISVLMWNHLSAFRCEDVRSRMSDRARGATTATSRAWPLLPPRLVWLAGSGPGARRMAAAAMADHMTKSRTMRRNSAIINNNNSRHKNSNSGLPISSSPPSPSSSYRDFQKDGLWVARHRPRSQRIPSMWDHAT